MDISNEQNGQDNVVPQIHFSYKSVENEIKITGPGIKQMPYKCYLSFTMHFV